MNENLNKYLSNSLHLSQNELEIIVDAFTLKSYKKGTLLLKEGEIERSFSYINKGCVRTYYVDMNAHIKTRHIAFENSLIGSLASFISAKPSFEYVETIENTELFSIERTTFFALLKEIPTWKDFYILLLEKGYLFQNSKIENNVTLDAKERYQKLMIEYPQFIERLPNTIIASYLDISPETLSRLKK